MNQPRDTREDRAALTAALSRADFGGAQLCSMLLAMEEGIQVWNVLGEAIYLNPATQRQFGARVAAAADYRLLAGLCGDEAGNPLGDDRFPVARVIKTGEASVDTLVQLSGATLRRRWLRINAYPLFAEEGGPMTAVVSATVDVTELIEHRASLQQQAYYDALTLLPNRVLLADRMKLAMGHGARSGEMLAVCLMDLDGFKAVNDSLGHEAGDQLLQEVARRLQDSIRGDDTAARLGGDEFVILLGGLKSAEQCEQAVKRLLDAAALPYVVAGNVVSISGSIGVTLYPADAADADQLLRHADQAMYKAKEAGRSRFVLYDPAAASRLRANQGLLRRIDEALAAGQFSLHYQPKVDCREGRVVGLEALMRWNHPVLGTRPAGEFLPLVEHDDIILRLGDWVIAEALRQMAAWRQAGIDLPVSVNVAAQQLARRGFDTRLAEALSRHPPELARRLEIEIIEAAALADINAVGTIMSRLRNVGVAFALDDFGTSYSSLLTLKRLPASALKIDRGLIHDMLDDPNDLAIVHGIVGLGQAFQQQVIAEGVETVEQVLTLLDLGCGVIQGRAIAMPMAAEAVPAWLAAFVPDPRWQAARTGFPTRAEFDLLLMETIHRQWLARVSASLREPAPDPRLLPADYGSCRLSEWYARGSAQRFAGRPEFGEVDRAHREVHRVAEALRERVGRGEAVLGAAGEVELVAASDELVARLRALRRATSEGA